MVGAGFDAWVVHDVNLRLKRWIGKGAYALESLRRFRRGAGGPYDVTVDGESYRASSVVVCNGHFYAGRYVLAPEARLDEPALHVCLFERQGRWNLLRYIVATLTNRAPGLPDVRLVKGTHVQIAGDDEPVQGDGDTLCRLPVTVDIVSGGIELVMPRPR
jgi:diacylglycerol kinase family enzyme